MNIKSLVGKLKQISNGNDILNTDDRDIKCLVFTLGMTDMLNTMGVVKSKVRLGVNGRLLFQRLDFLLWSMPMTMKRIIVNLIRLFL